MGAFEGDARSLDNSSDVTCFPDWPFNGCVAGTSFFM